MNPLDQIVTASEWAEHCGVSVQYIRRLCVTGKLNARQTKDGLWLIVKPDGKPYRKTNKTNGGNEHEKET